LNKCVLIGILIFSQIAFAENDPPAIVDNSKQNSSQELAQRNFYEVLEDLMGDFSFDLKNSQVTGLKNIAIRNVTLSENIPASFKTHLELLLTENILKHGKARVIQCLACKSRKTVLEKEKVVVSSAATSQMQLSAIAKANGISNFLDAAFTLESKAMILSLSITDAEEGMIVWSQNYNSQKSRIAAFKSGVDFSQLDLDRVQTEYVPMIQTRFMTYFFSQPNISKNTPVLALGFRFVERYRNRKAEVGFEVDYMASTLSIAKSSTTSTSTDLYHAYGFNFTALFLHAWNLIGSEENYNECRSSIMLGVGGSYLSGYLGGIVRSAYEVRLGKRFAFSLNLGYRPLAVAFLPSQETQKIMGLEYGMGIGILF
jgi:hypothetical protein